MTREDRLKVILSTICGDVRKAMLNRWSADSCIAASAIALDILAHFKIEAKPFPVITMVANRVSVDAMVANPDPTADEVDLIRQAGGHILQVAPDTEHNWSGHLVVVLPQDGIMIDASLDQFNREDKGIDIGPMVFPISEKFLAGEAVEEYVIEPDGVRVVYRKGWGRSGYRGSNDWRKKSRRQRLVRGSCELIEDRLARGAAE